MVYNESQKDKIIEYLSKALATRTKELRYWQELHLLETNQISESKFEENIKDFVISCDEKPTLEELKFIVDISHTGLFGDEDTIIDDFYTLFNLDMDHVGKLIENS